MATATRSRTRKATAPIAPVTKSAKTPATKPRVRRSKTETPAVDTTEAPVRKSTPRKATNGKTTGKIVKAAPAKVKAPVKSTPVKASTPKAAPKVEPIRDAWWDRIGGPRLREESINSGKHRALWTKADDKIVVSQKLTIPEIASRLGRSYHAVASRRAILKRNAEATGTK